MLSLTFAGDVIINSLSFRGEGHPNDPSFGSSDKFDISFDGGTTWAFDQQLINAKDGTVGFASC